MDSKAILFTVYFTKRMNTYYVLRTLLCAEHMDKTEINIQKANKHEQGRKIPTKTVKL